MWRTDGTGTTAGTIGLAALLVAGAGCNRATPTPNTYRWPDRLAYHVDYVSEAQRQRVAIMRYAESKTTRLMLRDGRQYLGAQDSVLKTSQRPGEDVMIVTYTPEDTLAFYVRIGTRGELSDVAYGCDPTVPQCRQALPSGLAMELRRIVPRLPVFEAPAGGGWDDTLTFDDADRPGGTRGTMITRYTGRRDTLIGNRRYWVVGWRAVRESYRRGALTPEQSVREDGVTLVDQQSLLPVFSTWAGAVAAPPAMQALGADASGFRGRAYLAGSVFDSSLVVRP